MILIGTENYGDIYTVLTWIYSCNMNANKAWNYATSFAILNNNIFTIFVTCDTNI